MFGSGWLEGKKRADFVGVVVAADSLWTVVFTEPKNAYATNGVLLGP